MKRYLLLVALVWAAVSTASAQQSGKAPWEEFSNRLKDSQSVGALGPDLFGDNVGLADGALSFSVTDVELAGNNALPVAFARKYVVFNRKDYISDSPLADWGLDVPSISGVFAPNWTVSNPTPSVARCSKIALPTQPLRDYYARDFWHGNTLNLPDGGGGELLLENAALPAPATGENFLWTTSDHVRIACLAKVKNTTGEGFLAITPDGTRYWFDWMAQYHEPLLVMPGRRSSSGFWDNNPIQRRKNVLYATKVQDRFGNTVNYTYTNVWNKPAVLTRIAASDGRQIDITYASGNVSTVRAGTRTWTFTYGNTPKGKRTLTAVRQPDLSQWTIGFAAFTDAYMEYRVGSQMDPARSCLQSELPINSRDEPLGTIKHPSGAIGAFRVGIRSHGRSNVPINCENVTTTPSRPPGVGNDTNDDMNLQVISYDSFTLLDKTLSGPGISTQQWSYSYSPNISSYLTPGATVRYPVCSVYADPARQKECYEPRCRSDVCAGASQTIIAGTNGKWTRYSYGNSFLYNEGKLLKVEQGSDAAHVLRSVANTYDLSRANKVYPASVGRSLRKSYEGFGAEYPRPLTRTVTTQDGVTFSASNDVFDVFARPLTVTKSSSLGYTRTEATSYLDNLGKWVLGQVRSVTKTSPGPVQVMSSVAYDAATAMPIRFYGFGTPTVPGKLQQTLTYNLDGTIATVKDGRNYVTKVSNWKRGVPQKITYPDATSESMMVNNDGTIASVTDENGFATSYDYDAMGRLASIAYPTADSTVWNRTTSAFVPVAASEYGIPAGHWRQTTSTGNARKVTYFDALWRPVVTREYDAANVAGTQRFTRRAYDGAGRPAFVSYPGTTNALTTGIRTSYDAIDRPTQVRQDSELGVLTTTTAYLAGFQTRVTNPRGKQTLTIYQAYDQPTYDWPRGISHPEGAYTEIYRDVFGKPTAVRRRNLDASQTAWRRYVYDAYQQLCKTIEPETGSTVMAYDAAGNLAWSASGQALASTTACQDTSVPVASRTTRSYDPRNRVSALNFPGGRGNTSYDYTADGLLESLTADNGAGNLVTTNYTYNKRRLPTSERMLWGSINWPIDYAYDANASLTSQVWQGQSVSYAPNALGQPTRVGTYATGVSYFPNGALKQFTYGNGIVHTLTQNARQLPDTSRDAYGTAEVLDDGYDYDQNANVVAISDGLTGARGNRTMTYDGLDRLTAATSPMFNSSGQGTVSYGYDVLDNLTTVVALDRNHRYCYNTSHQLVFVRSNASTCSNGSAVTTLEYDVQGNLANKNGVRYDFDSGNRLRSVSGGPGIYAYDGHGRRVRDFTTASKYSQYSQAGQLTFTSNARHKLQQWYLYLNGSLVAIRERNTAAGAVNYQYQHTDALGSPVAVTNSARKVIKRNEYEPYGKLLNRPLTDGPGYTGHVMDATTGLAYMQQRYYDPGIGRFLSVDPVAANGNTGGNFNRYWYANNNPYKFTDPDGRQSKPQKPFFTYQVIKRTERKESRGSSVMVERKTIKNYGIVHGNDEVGHGSVKLLPQNSANQMPATVGDRVMTRLLNFSDKEGRTVEVTSGQRTPQQNAAVRGATRSQHLSDNASDIRIQGYTKTQTADAAYQSGEFNRVNEYPDSRGTHVDLRQGGAQGRLYNWERPNEN